MSHVFGFAFLVIFAFLISIASAEVTLTVLHTNDVHSRFLQTSKYSGACSPEEEANKQCYGGFARLHYKVKEIRATTPNVIYLSGGDYYQGTVWYTLFKWRIISHFVNQLNHTAMAFGNHEFDDNIAGVVPFLEAATFPVISSNIDDSKEPTFQRKYNKSIVVEVEGGRKVGIIGYTTEETMAISNPGNLIFTDVPTAVGKEAQRLYNEGVRILIAVGHAGYDVDKLVAQVPLIDAVVGGHTNTFLYSGKPPDVEEALAEYPTIITQSDGRKVPVVQAYAFGKYLGYLNLTFDDNGELSGWAGNPILLDSSVPEDKNMLDDIRVWGKNITDFIKKEVGKTRVFLDGRTNECRLRECNLANLITDAMVYMNLKFPDEVQWSDVTMAIMNSGGVRSSISQTARNGSITMEDILTVLPFQNTIDLIEIRGKHLKESFEFSVQGYDPTGQHLAGKFLQVSGMKVEYDISKPVGSRVRKLLGLCNNCTVPRFIPIQDETVYKIAVPTYLATGGDGYQVIKNNAIAHHLSGILDSDMMLEFLKLRSPVYQGVEGRIEFVTGSQCDFDDDNSASGILLPPSTSVFCLLSLLSAVLSLRF